MNRVDKAKELFAKNFNCAQSVLAAFCGKYGLDEITALKSASGLGGGFRCGEICGAAAGAVLVIGLKNGQSSPDDLSSKKKCYGETETFMNSFRQANGSLICRELLGCDITTDKGRAQAKEKHLFETRCVDQIVSAVSILEKMGY